MLHGVDRVLLQQLQNTDVLLGAAAGPVLLFQGLPQLVEDGRQTPAAKNIGVIQRRRPALEAVQIMLRGQDLLVPAIGAPVRSDHLRAQHDVDAVHVRLDVYLLESGRARHAIAVGVVAHLLILVHLRRLVQARIERLGGQ